MIENAWRPTAGSRIYPLSYEPRFAYIILQRKDLVRSNDLLSLLLGRLGASFGAGSAAGALDEQVHGAKVCCGAIQGHSG